MAARRQTPNVFETTERIASDDVALAFAGSAAVKLPVTKCRTNGGTQSRVRIDDAVVNRYRDDLAKGDNFEPIEVFFDGTDYWVSDGFHRLQAHIALGLAEINAVVRQGTRRDAVLASTGANSRHGLQRTQEDIRRAVMVMLEDEEWSQWSDRKIADTAHVSHQVVARLRKLMNGDTVAVVNLPVVIEAVQVNAPRARAQVSIVGNLPALSQVMVSGEWDALTWAVHDWAMSLPEHRRLFELKDAIMTRQSGRFWKGIVSAVEAAGVEAKQGAIIDAISKVRVALDNKTVPIRAIAETIGTYQEVPTKSIHAEPAEIMPRWRVEHQPDGRRLMIHNKDGKETKYLLTAVEAMFLSAELAHAL